VSGFCGFLVRLAPWTVLRCKGSGKDFFGVAEHPFPPVLQVSPEDRCPSGWALSSLVLCCHPRSPIWADVMRAGTGRALSVPSSDTKPCGVSRGPPTRPREGVGNTDL